MEGMLSETKEDTAALTASVAELLREHKGQEVSVLDLRTLNNWTDFFIIATVSSKTHMDGLERHIKDYCRTENIEILGCSPRQLKTVRDDEWRLLDLGFAVIHLMTERTREFYDLERLWRPTMHPKGVDEPISMA